MIFECTVNVLCIYMKSSEKLTILMSARNTYYPILKNYWRVGAILIMN